MSQDPRIVAAREIKSRAFDRAALADIGPRSLAELAVRCRTTRDAIATAVGVRPRLLENVDRGIQPLPLGVIRQIATLLDLPMYLVTGACRTWIASNDARLLNPHPRRPTEAVL